MKIIKSISVKLLLLLILTSCFTYNFQYVLLIEDAILYTKEDLTSTQLTTIPKGNYVYLSYTKSHSYSYKKVKWNKYEGFVYTPVYSNFNNYSGNSTYKKNYNTGYRTNQYYNNYNYGGTVHVKGYYRKDGTYVRPHTRRAPRR